MIDNVVHHPARGVARAGIDADLVLHVLPFPVLVLGADNVIEYVNGAAEQFFEHGQAILRGRGLDTLVPADSPLFSLFDHVRATGSSVSEYDISLTFPLRATRELTVQVAPYGDAPERLIVAFSEQSIAKKIDRQLVHRNAARSVSSLAAMLAHEVKNPLSGIKGAAQLLEQTANDDDKTLTRLICEESDRINALVDRMGIFSDTRPPERRPINIHEVLKRVRMIAEAGFARDVRIVEEYDPSLPHVSGNFDQLIQVFLNLIKNASEAAPRPGGEIVIRSAYQHGVRLAVPGAGDRVELPIVIAIQDNGQGIPEDIAAHLFDPFVTTKNGGSGLGLALVAKLVGDHGGVIEFDTEPGRTVFKVMLPVSQERVTRKSGGRE